MWSSDKLTEVFIDFFKNKEHKIVESESLIPKADKTLLFTSAGMVQFKPLWAGEIPLEYKRATTVQKCLRLSDLEQVGKTYWHDTFFEMLGNFSFGDYFKNEAIEWAWEFLLEILKIDHKKLYISVYPDDNESYNIWNKNIGVPSSKIIRHPDNFWEPTGSRGACGPDTEIFYDLGNKFGKCKFDGECNRYIEFWNLVFPEFNQIGNKRIPLKNRGVDTGMGLERLAMIMQNKSSIFETDLFFPIIEEIQKISGKKYNKHKQILNIIADHSRALVFAIADGVYPSNEGRGYVLRRLLRRALTKAKKLGIEKPFIHLLVPSVISIMKKRYPYLKEKIEHITLIIKSEEEHFLSTLNSGVLILNEIIEKSKKNKKKKIKGRDAFKLYDTYGFPLTLTEELAKEKGLDVDKIGFEKEMKKQKERAREKHEFEAEEKVKWKTISKEESKFVGYTNEEVNSDIIAYRKLNEYYEIILKRTPFYAEEGGQVGDTGELIGDKWSMIVEDTYPSPLGNVHKGKLKGKFKLSNVNAIIDKERRFSIKRNHTTTHILHRVLRENLGDWVKQEGSSVGPDRFRFDFTHPKPLKNEEIDKIEDEVNKVINRGLPVKKEILPYDEAIKKGAVALFDEQYGDLVRMVSIQNFTKELCGGTHLNNTIEAGIFKIISETGIASGVRRIEGVTGWHAYKEIKKQEHLLEKLEFLMKSDRDSLGVRLEKTIKQIKEQKRKIEKMENLLVNTQLSEMLKNTSTFNGHKYVAAAIDGSKDTLRKLSEKLRNKLADGAGLLATKIGSSVFIVIFVGNKLKDFINAGELARETSKIIGGSGGGKATMAEGGGNKVGKIDKLISDFPGILKKHISKKCEE